MALARCSRTATEWPSAVAHRRPTSERTRAHMHARVRSCARWRGHMRGEERAHAARCHTLSRSAVQQLSRWLCCGVPQGKERTHRSDARMAQLLHNSERMACGPQSTAAMREAFAATLQGQARSECRSEANRGRASTGRSTLTQPRWGHTGEARRGGGITPVDPVVGRAGASSNRQLGVARRAAAVAVASRMARIREVLRASCVRENGLEARLHAFPLRVADVPQLDWPGHAVPDQLVPCCSPTAPR